MEVPVWQLLVIPCVAAVVGWFTNWLAVWMTFHPTRFVGLPPYLGWQGILPSKAEKMARIVSQRALAKLGTVQEFVGRFDRGEVTRLVTMLGRDEVHDAVDHVMSEQAPEVWSRVPEPMRIMVYARAQTALPEAVGGFLLGALDNIENLLSLEDLSVGCVRRDPTLVNRIFQRAGEVEFRFIVLSGLWVGAALGVLVSLFWSFHSAWWVLPVAGFLVGYLTNWIALNIIFRPLNPVQIGPWTLQGIFLKRQEAVAEAWASVAAGEVVTLANIMQTVAAAPAGSPVQEMLLGDVRKRILELLEKDRAVLQAFLRVESLDSLADAGARHTLAIVSEFTNDPHLRGLGNREVETLIRERMCAMSPEQYQDVLRPAFQEEEIKLILLGSILGMIAGIAQTLLF